MAYGCGCPEVDKSKCLSCADVWRLVVLCDKVATHRRAQREEEAITRQTKVYESCDNHVTII